MNLDLLALAPLNASVAKFIFGNHACSELIILNIFCAFRLLHFCNCEDAAIRRIEGGHRRDMDSAGCSSDNTGPIRTRNVKFTKSGKFCRGHTGRKYDKSHGFITPATKASEKTTETITITDMESSDEEVERMEKRLAKLLELKYKRRNLDN